MMNQKNTLSILSTIMVALVCACMVSCDDENDPEPKVQEEQFSVCTLNVDGLVGLDNPGPEYTPVIGQWLTQGGFDFIGVQEDFDYDQELSGPFAEGYDFDCWGGGMMNGVKLIYEPNEENPEKIRFNTDGLKGFWKKGLKVERTDSVRWNRNCGYFAHAWDENVVKGFRRYEVTTPLGHQLVIYNMHMDAGDTEEELAGTDEEDRLVRMSQWRQLRDYIMAHLDHRPIIIMGDLNTYYVRDSVESQVINVINRSGRATITDAWIQQEKGGKYPSMGDTRIQYDSPTSGWTVNGEAPDKVFFINPTASNSKLILENVIFHNKTYFREDGVSPLGDHYPLSVHFRIK